MSTASGDRSLLRFTITACLLAAAVAGTAGLASLAVDTSDLDAAVVEPERFQTASDRVFTPTLAPAPVLLSKVDTAPDESPASTPPSPVDTDVVAGSDTDETATTEIWKPLNGTYRSVCVRLCDGAFVPLSFATSVDRLSSDTARCSSACGAEARLFIAPPDAPADALVDLQGRRYLDLPTAFAFRKSYDASCTCKWNRAEPTLQAALEPALEPGHTREPSGATQSDAITQASAEPVPSAPVPTTPGGTWGLETAALGQTAAVPLPTRRPTGAMAPPPSKRKVRNAYVASDSLLGRRTMQRSFRSSDYWRISYWHDPD